MRALLLCSSVGSDGMFWITWDALRGYQNWPEQGFGGKRTAAGLSDFLLTSSCVNRHLSSLFAAINILVAISAENTEFFLTFKLQVTNLAM